MPAENEEEDASSHSSSNYSFLGDQFTDFFIQPKESSTGPSSLGNACNESDSEQQISSLVEKKQHEDETQNLLNQQELFERFSMLMKSNKEMVTEV